MTETDPEPPSIHHKHHTKHTASPHNQDAPHTFGVPEWISTWFTKSPSGVDIDTDTHDKPLPPTDQADRQNTDLGPYKSVVPRACFVLNACIALLWASMITINALTDGIISTTGWSLSDVSLLFTLQVFTTFLFCPIWGAAAPYVSSRKLMAVSLFIGAGLNVATAFASLYDPIIGPDGNETCAEKALRNNVTSPDYVAPRTSQSYWLFCVLQLLKGVMLAPLQTLTRSLIPKYYPLEVRGQYYGLFEIAAGIGGVSGAVFGLFSYFGEQPRVGYYGAIPKWGVPFLVLAAFMVPAGLAVLKFVVDPVMDTKFRDKVGPDLLYKIFPGLRDDDVKLSWKTLKISMRSKTWVFTVLQGVTGAFPWPSLAMMLYWFQLFGVDSFLSILVSAGPGLGAAFGGGIGGLIGDKLYQKWSKKYGRVVTSQISVTTGPFLFIVTFFALPQDPDMWWAYGLYGMASGLFISWSAPNNNANLSDVMEEALFPAAYGISQLFEGSVSAWSPYAASQIAEKLFGVGELVDLECKSDEVRQSDARGLARAMFSICCVGWGLCIICITGLYFSYPKESLTLRRFAEEEKRKALGDDVGSKRV